MPETPSDIDRRGLPDRRARPTPFLSRYTFTGRRRGGRRAGEDENIYVDRHGAREWSSVVAILILCLIDWRLTLDYIAVGGEEWNPIMAWALEEGEGVFGAIKMGVTTAGLAILLLHSRFRVSATGITVILVLYAALTIYHVHLKSSLDHRQAQAVVLDRAAAAESRESLADTRPSRPESSVPEPGPTEVGAAR